VWHRKKRSERLTAERCMLEPMQSFWHIYIYINIWWLF
jgi:hypothetical protein